MGTPASFIYRQIGDPSFWGDVPHADLRIGASMRRAAGLIALWQGAADEIVRRYRVDPARIHVIPNARDGDAIRPADADQKRAARRRLDLPEGGAVALYLGALSWEKRPADAIEAVAVIADMTLLVAGDGPLRAEMEALAEQVAPGRVQFLGVVTQPLLLLHASDAVINCSATEGMAGALLEAGLAGVPAVATDVASASEVVDDGVTGVLVPVGRPDAIADGLQEIMTRQEQMSTATRAWSESRFVFPVVMPQWATLMRTVARSEPGDDAG